MVDKAKLQTLRLYLNTKCNKKTENDNEHVCQDTSQDDTFLSTAQSNDELDRVYSPENTQNVKRQADDQKWDPNDSIKESEQSMDGQNGRQNTSE